MKQLLIFSDTHDYIDPCISVIKSTKNLAAIIHAGDCVPDAEDIHSIFPEIPIYYVKGNNDFYSSAPNSLTLSIEGKRIYIVHGHMQSVKLDTSLSCLKEQGQKSNADLIVFGHTHMPLTEYSGKMIIINPGSVRFSSTYAIAEIKDDVLKTSIKTF